MRDELAPALDRVVEIVKLLAVGLDGESRHPPDQFAQQIDERRDVVDHKPRSGCLDVDDLQSRRACGRCFVVGVSPAAGLRLWAEKELDQLQMR